MCQRHEADIRLLLLAKLVSDIEEAYVGVVAGIVGHDDVLSRKLK